MGILTIYNTMLVIGIIIFDIKIIKENAELREKNDWQEEKIRELVNTEDKSIVEERTIEAENIT